MHDESVEMEEESDINLTPMLDVVFIMLIFFIVTSVFVREPGVEVVRPEAATAFAPDAASIFIAITPNNEIWIDGSPVEIPALRGEIERLQSQNPEGGIVVQADQNARNRLLLNVMDAAKSAGVTDITIAAARN